MKKLISALLALALLFSCLTMVTGLTTAYAVEDEDYPTTEVWSPVEIKFVSTTEHSNPYVQVEIDATFVNRTDNTTITVPGFWYEGNTWAVRFSPTKTGLWDYTISATDTAAAVSDLNGKTGTIQATAATSTTNTAQHGFIKIADDNRHFAYNDGTSFFWLGDTNWQSPSTNSTTKCNYPGCNCGGQFQHIVNDRVSKGFTVYQTYFSATSTGKVQGNTSYWSGTSGNGGANLYPNTSVFNSRLDFMFSYLAEKDMVAAVGFGCASSTTKSFSLDTMKRFARYIVARYGCYNFAWISGQEINMESCRAENTAYDSGETAYSVYKAVSAYVDEIDGYNHPNSGHQQGGSDATTEWNQDLAAQSWHDYTLDQGGHSNPMTKEFYQSYYDLENYVPYVEGELQYEEINCGPFTGYDKPRYGAWKAVLSGTAGFTYGASGVWAASYSTNIYTGWLGGDSTYSYEPWYMGVDKQGSYEVGYMKKFITSIADWDKLTPQFYSDAYCDFGDSDTAALMVSPDAHTFVAYFYNSNLSTGTLINLDKDAYYNAVWYNPRTGSYIKIDENIYCDNGVYAIPSKPTSEDWALLVTTASVEGLTYENAYMIDASAVTITGDTLTPVSFKANGGITYTGYAQIKHDNTSYLTDGNLNTVWEPFADRATQFFTFDFGTPKALTNIIITPEEGTIIPDYRVYASNDAENWTIILDTAVNGTMHKAGNSYAENLYGGWRYVKVMLMNPESFGGEVTKDFETYYNKYMKCTYSHTAIAEIAINGTGNAVEYGYSAPASPVAPEDEDLSKIFAVGISTGAKDFCMYHGKGYVTPFLGVEFPDGQDTMDVTLAIYNATDVTINDFVLSNYWGTHCYLTTDATSEFNCGGKGVNIAPGETKEITLHVPREAYYSNASGAITDTAHPNADGSGKLCSYKNVGIRINYSAAPTSGEILIACENSTISKNFYQSEWHAISTVRNVNFAEYLDNEDLLWELHDIIGHTPGIVEGTPATCIDTGLTEGLQCVICTEWITEQTVIPATGHKYNATSEDATCYKAGTVTYRCANCEDSYVSDTLMKLPHTYTDKVIAATETNMGYTIHECTVCGECTTDSYVNALINETATLGVKYSVAKNASNMVGSTVYDGTTMKPFRNLDFGDGDFCSVSLLVVNGTDGTFNGISLAQAWGTFCYLSEADATAGKTVSNPTYSSFNIAAGEATTITLNIPREAYYSNKAGQTYSANGGGGTKCSYQDIDLRLGFGGNAANGGYIYIIPLNHTEILTSLSGYSFSGTTATTVKYADLPTKGQDALEKLSGTKLSDGKTFIDFESASDIDYIRTYGEISTGVATKAELSSEHSLSGSTSLKLTSGNAAYASAAIKANALENVIDGLGAYRVSGYVYVESLDSDVSLNFNLRQTDNGYYNAQYSGTKFYSAEDEVNPLNTYVGKWRRFEGIYNITESVVDDGVKEFAEGVKYLTADWVDNMQSLALDGIGGAGGVFYFDNLQVEKITEFGTKLTYSEHIEEKLDEETQELKSVDSTQVYTHTPFCGFSDDLEDGTYTYTYRAYNINDFDISLFACMQGGDRPSYPENHNGNHAIGWDYLAGTNTSDYKIVAAGEYIDLKYTFTVEDGYVTFTDYDTKLDYQDKPSTLKLRLDIDREALVGGSASIVVVEVTEGDDKCGVMFTAPGFGSKSLIYSDTANEYGLDDYIEAGHSWAILTTNATCTEAGKVERYCTDEDCDKCELISVIPALGHTAAVDAAVAADCENTGLTEGSHCSVCDEVLVAQEVIPAIGHNFNGFYARKAATETANGYDIKYCSNCGTYKSTILTKTGATTVTGVKFAPKGNNGAQLMTKFGIDASTGDANTNTTPFKELAFGNGDTCDVKFLIVNNTDVNFKCFSLSCSWGYNAYTDATTKFTGAHKDLTVEPGAATIVTVTVPRNAYYSNSNSSNTDGANDSCGHLVNYTQVGLRMDFTAKPTTGTLNVYCLTDNTVNKNLLATPIASQFTSSAAYESTSMPATSDGAFMDFEMYTESNYVTTLGSAKAVYTNERAMSGNYSIKVSGGTADYAGAAIAGDVVNTVINEAGTYRFSGWIYFETLPVAVANGGKVTMCANLRDKKNKYYQTKGMEVDSSFKGVWKRFEFTLDVPSGQLITDSTADGYWLNYLGSLALDRIGNGSVYYLDDLSITKVDANEGTTFAKQLTFKNGISGNQGYYVAYNLAQDVLTAYGEGEHTFKFRVYNYSCEEMFAYVHIDPWWTAANVVATGHRAGKTEDEVYCKPYSYVDLEISFTVNADGTVSGNKHSNVACNTTNTRLALRLDIKACDDGKAVQIQDGQQQYSMIFVDTTTDAKLPDLSELTSKLGVGAQISDITSVSDMRYSCYTSFSESHVCSENAVEDAAVAATCCKTGLTAGSHCSICGETVVAQEATPIDPDNHNMATEYHAATGTTQAYNRHYCTNEGCTYETIEYISAEVVKGDVNGDGKITLKDRMTLARYLQAWEGYTINEANSDINGDSEVNSADLDILTKYLAGWEGYEDLNSLPEA